MFALRYPIPDFAVSLIAVLNGFAPGADQDATLSVCDGNVTVTMDATLTDAEREDLQMWLAECLRQCSTATEGANEELAERWQGRAKRAAAMIERLGGVE